jgi:hypothetical protein
MSGSPNYSFRREPTFSVNHISEYLATENAAQRTKILRAAKFPKKVEVAAYGQVRAELKVALSAADFGADQLAFLVERLDAKARREIGYAKDEALRCKRAVEAFISHVSAKRFRGYQIVPAPEGLILSVSKVRIKVSMDAAVLQTVGETTNSGGIALVYSFSSDRDPIEPRLRAMTGLMLWALEGGQIEPLPRLCMAVDLATGNIAKASSSHARLREHVRESCDEAAARWPTVEPPDDYDGPDWR